MATILLSTEVDCFIKKERVLAVIYDKTTLTGECSIRMKTGTISIGARGSGTLTLILSNTARLRSLGEETGC